jgi:hypothetical protein
VGDAQQSVLGRTVAAPTPCGEVGGVHLVEVVDPGLVRVVAYGAQRTVGFVLTSHRLRLIVVGDYLRLLVEHALYPSARRVHRLTAARGRPTIAAKSRGSPHRTFSILRELLRSNPTVSGHEGILSLRVRTGRRLHPL